MRPDPSTGQAGHHTGGNENMGQVCAFVVAHENVRKRTSGEHFNHIFDRKTPPSPEGALLVVTFAEGVLPLERR